MIDIQFGFTDVKAKQDSTPVATDVQPWTSPAQLKSESPPTGHYATLEDDFFRLDGSLELFPDDPKPEQFGWWSKSMSDAAGAFAAPITLDIGFSQNHSSIGLTLVFEEIGNNYPSAFTVKWYASGTLLAERAVRPDSWYCTVSQAVTDYNRITLTFTGTNRPYRYLKVRDLLFGIIKHFNDTSGLASKAPINSPALTGSPTAPTPVEGDKTTKIATTAFVQSAIIKQIRGSVSAGSYDTTITLGVKPFLVILYSNSNNDHNTMFQSSAAYLYDTPRIITDLYSGTAGSIISTGFTISRAGTAKTIYYVALYI